MQILANKSKSQKTSFLHLLKKVITDYQAAFLNLEKIFAFRIQGTPNMSHTYPTYKLQNTSWKEMYLKFPVIELPTR